MIHIAIGVLCHRKRVLTAWRSSHRPAGGCWEFPGGKVRVGESFAEALQRELYEEIGIRALLGLPVICLRYDYPDRKVMLDVHEVTASVQTVCARQKQFLRWYPVEKLREDDFPPANRSIINALKLPHLYAMTPSLKNSAQIMQSVHKSLNLSSDKPRLIVLRAPQLTDYASVAERILPMTEASGAQLMLHDQCDLAKKFGDKIAGMHLSQSAFQRVLRRPVASDRWFAVSCHNLAEITQATEKGADFCVLGPVKDTSSHPQQPSLGFDTFAEIVDQANIPVFALGGMQPSDVEYVRRQGGQGVAGIRCFQNA